MTVKSWKWESRLSEGKKNMFTMVSSYPLCNIFWAFFNIILVFMRRVCGPEKYYLFDNAKTLRENLEGKGKVQS